MINTSKEYWFFLLPDIYVSRKNSNMLLYNTTNGQHIKVYSSALEKLVEDIYTPSNNGVAKFNPVSQTTENLSLVKELIEKGFAKIVEIKENELRPMVFLPILNLQKDIVKMEKQENFSIGKDLIAYLSELTLYINSNCKNNCGLCNKYYKQTLSCLKYNNGDTLSLELIDSVLAQIKCSSVKKVNVIGGNIMLYPNWMKLNAVLSKYDYSYHYWISIKNLIQYQTTILNTFVNRDILITFPLNQVEESMISNFASGNTFFHFLIENEEQYQQSVKIISDCRLDKYNIVPIYNDTNISFFIDNVYMNEYDVFSSTISHREIFRNQKLNANYFGKLYVLPNGDVKASNREEILGNASKDAIIKLIYEEIKRNTAWRKTRDVLPCCECLYQDLCPPLSNYEMEIGKINLCNIQK